MATRLERLLQLLEAGSNGVIRSHASEQIGEIQREHPHKLPTLLKLLHPYLQSKQWSTRVAAARSIELCCKHMQLFLDKHQIEKAAQVSTEQQSLESPHPTLLASSSSSTSASAASSASSSAASLLLNLHSFNVASVISKGRPMLSSSGNEYTAATTHDLSSLPLNERVLVHRKELLKRLGCYEEFGGTGNIIQEQDVQMDTEESNARQSSHTSLTSPAAASSFSSSSSPDREMSAREKNKARRDAKNAEKRKREENQQLASEAIQMSLQEAEEAPAHKRTKLTSDSNSASLVLESELEVDAGWNSSNPMGMFILRDGTHVLTRYVSQLLWELLDENWEKRHGAALGLRAILKFHSQDLGFNFHQSRKSEENQRMHQDYLADTCARILCVLLLDRFADYAFERVVYPVRETAAQILPSLSRHLSEQGVVLLVDKLVEITQSSEDELRYGAFIGLKYVLSVHFLSGESSPTDVLSVPLNRELFARCFPTLLQSILVTTSDDVRGLILDSLSASVQCVTRSAQPTQFMNETQFTTLVSSLWQGLLQCDDLTSSTGQFLQLLRLIYEWIHNARYPSIASGSASNAPSFLLSHTLLGLPLPSMLARLYPFIQHPSHAVVIDAFRTIYVILKLELLHVLSLPDKHLTSALPSLTVLLRLIFQCIMLQSDAQVIDTGFLVLQLFTQPHVNPTTKVSQFLFADPTYQFLFDTNRVSFSELLLSPLFRPIDPRLFIRPTMKDAQQDDILLSSVMEDASTPPLTSMTSSFHVVSNVEMKLRGAKAYGELFARLACIKTLTSNPTASVQTCSPHILVLWNHVQSQHDLYVQMACLKLSAWWSCTPPRDIPSLPSSTQLKEWVNMLSRMIDPAISTRNRSPNTKSVVAQAIICAFEREADIACTSTLLLCIPPLVYTIQNEQALVVLQQRAGEFLCKLLQILLIKESKVKPEEMEDPLAEDSVTSTLNGVLTRLMDLLCAVLPTPPQTPPSSVSPRAMPIAYLNQRLMARSMTTHFGTDENEANQTEEQLIALLKSEVHANEEKAFSPLPIKFDSSSAQSSAVTPPLPDKSLPVFSSPAASVAARGALFFFSALCRDTFSTSLFESYPVIWQMIQAGFDHLDQLAICMEEVMAAACRYEIKKSLDLLVHLVPNIAHRDHVHLLTLLPLVYQCIFLPLPKFIPIHSFSIPCLARKVLVAYVEHIGASSLESILKHLVPLLGGVDLAKKVAVLQLLQALFLELTIPLVPYLPFLVSPVLSCMSSSGLPTVLSTSSTSPVTAMVAPSTPTSSSSPSAPATSESARLIASDIFARMMQLIPLEPGIPHPAEMSVELQTQRLEHRKFLQQLVDGTQVDDITLPKELLTSGLALRGYQREGIKWMNFLHQFHLSGILCDEMGTGKTIQCLAMMALTIMERRSKFQNELANVAAQKTSSSKSGNSGKSVLPSSLQSSAPLSSLIICPSTLLHHWQYEIKKCINSTVCPLRVVVYEGSTNERAKIRTDLFQSLAQKDASTLLACSVVERAQLDPIVLISYESIRKDAAHFRSLPLHHLILDEGHLIKNSASQLSKAIKSLQSHSRFILTGTPLNNHVLELWSLFDFLMPGYLGSEKEFQEAFAKSIQKARNIELDKPTRRPAAKRASNTSPPSLTSSTADETQELEEQSRKQQQITVQGNLALERLHRRVLPFLLRRLKMDVLADLPPKIIQDYYVDLSPLQNDLYQLVLQPQEDQLQKQAEEVLASTAKAGVKTEPTSGQSMHTFQALHYMRKLCTHPSLVFNQQHPQFKAIQDKYQLDDGKHSIHSLKNSSKLMALKQLLRECGIGSLEDAELYEAETSVDVDSLLAHEKKKLKREKRQSGDGQSDSLEADYYDDIDEKKQKKLKEKKANDTDATFAAITSIDSVVSRNRVLIFAQIKSTLDIIERDLFQASSSDKNHTHPNQSTGGFTPNSVSYLRLDGSVSASRRFELVQQFNADPSIDCMLLTTSVGGLGLNLTSADTVIFVEHDWSPMKDLQASDRCHRLGQQASVVNIYRIICQNTLEERIMGLQRFKTHVAQSVVNVENASMSSMDTSQLLSRLEQNPQALLKQERQVKTDVTNGSEHEITDRLTGSHVPASTQAATAAFSTLDANLEEYEAEYDLSSFLQSFQ